MMKFLVQERFQDSGWETVESFDGIRAAVSRLEEAMKCPLSGMGRIVKTLPEGFGHEAVVIVELPGCGWTEDAAEKLHQIYSVETKDRLDDIKTFQRKMPTFQKKVPESRYLVWAVEEIEDLRERLRASHGGCRLLSEGDNCDCGLCKRDLQIAVLKDVIKSVVVVVRAGETRLDEKFLEDREE